MEREGGRRGKKGSFARLDAQLPRSPPTSREIREGNSRRREGEGEEKERGRRGRKREKETKAGRLLVIGSELRLPHATAFFLSFLFSFSPSTATDRASPEISHHLLYLDAPPSQTKTTESSTLNPTATPPSSLSLPFVLNNVPTFPSLYTTPSSFPNNATPYTPSSEMTSFSSAE